YELFACQPEEIPALLARRDICGLNVTIPYKQALWPYLAGASPAALALGAVNVLRRRHGAWWGENTDVIGFERSLQRWMGLPAVGASPPARQRLRAAVVLGDGGASAAVQYVLHNWGLPFDVVSRRPRPQGSGPGRAHLTYDAWREAGGFRPYGLCVQTTPVGMYPEITGELPLPYDTLAVSPESPFYFYDVVYNPEPTAMMRRMAASGARVKGGLEMLHLQADAAWELWQAKIS
ncbi:MAG: hypothetical protein K2O01_02945, partial [Bacteroidales bacterium]|nr:hypothetical protein [Bacteroidales bacterium]